MQLEVAAESMREAHTQLRLAGRLYDAKMARLDNSAMKSAVGRLERYYKAELAWRDAHIEHGAAEKVALAEGCCMGCIVYGAVWMYGCMGLYSCMALQASRGNARRMYGPIQAV